MELLQSIAALRESLMIWQGKTIGLVPTMGALHEGHLSLIDRCHQECDATVVSIFVNPLQFAPAEDFAQYPRSLDTDLQQCQTAGVDVLFVPEVEELLPHIDQKTGRVRVSPPPELLQHLCAPFRLGHFEGVLTIVATLFNIVQPTRAYFGQKDAQQLVLIRHLVHDLHYPAEIVACSTIRDSDGLALSSRNRYLSESERSLARQLFQSLLQGKRRLLRGEVSDTRILEAVHEYIQKFSTIQVQYLELVDPATLQPLTEVKSQGLLAIAAYIGTTRLIDNILLQRPVSILPTTSRQPLIAIDGPAGAGKSTVARQVAAELNLLYLDTGAMYRAITWLALEQGVSIYDEAQLAQLASEADLQLNTQAAPNQPTQVWVNGQDITDVIRSAQVTEQVSTVSAFAQVRQALVRQQRAIGQQGGVVLEGRDIGTQVFPDAELKIFLTASAGERAQRRQRELASKGEQITINDLKQQIVARDRYDSRRSISPLRQAPDAIVINTDTLSQSEVKDRIVQLYCQIRSTVDDTPASVQ